ncbi:hypothetical protein LCGC14_1081190 [marine sediment metagenome]|uniref:Radical SAM core domain-containing protein n=1 Tax=marine sediment metagenome TaxID=412755 RepID=A0A0F9PYC1_9ZZZZ
MNKTRIEWVKNKDGTQGYTSNPIRGKCPVGCWYCYAEKMRKRFKWPEEIIHFPEEIISLLKLKKPSTIFIGSMIDIWDKRIPANYQNWVVDTIASLQYDGHNILLLSKNPDAYHDFPYIENLWCGFTSDNGDNLDDINDALLYMKNKTFISFEPLLREIILEIPSPIDWLIIGSLNINGKPVSPDKGGTKKEWVLPLIKQADKYNIPVFIKNELYQLYPDLPVRKELNV